MSYRRARVACCSLNTVSGLKRWYSPSRRHWYSPPRSSVRWARCAGFGGYAVACRLAISSASTSSPTPPSRLDRAGEVLVDELVAEADRLEDLRTGVGRDRRDAHLRHHLQHALAGGLDVVLHGLVRVDAGEAALDDQVLDGLEREVRVDGAGAVADEQRHVMHLAGVARLDRRARPACGSSHGSGGGARPTSSAATGSARGPRSSRGPTAR